MKKVTNDNYFDVWKKISRADGIGEIPVELSQSHETVKSIHEMGGWNALDGDADLKEFKDLFFESLQDFIEKNAPDIFSDAKGNETADESEPDEKPKRERKKKVKEETPEPEPEEEEEVEKTEVTRDETPPAEKHLPKKEGKKRIQRPQASLVNSFPAEYKVIRKVAHLNGKAKSRSQLLRILKSLQKDILEHRIRKSSPYADEIISIQKQLVTAVKTLKDEKPIPIHLAEAAMTRFNKIIGEEALRPSIQLIKRYVSLHGQSVDKEKAERLLAQIQQGIAKGKIAKKDPYFKEVKKIEKSLKTFIDQGCGMLSIHTPELDGLNGILSGCGCNNLHGLDGIPTNANGAFRTDQLPDSSHLTLEFSGKWRDLFGQPAQGFSVMTYGLPKTGKSTLMLEFAGYLASQFGKVLWVELEEDLFTSFKEKVDRLNVGHPDFHAQRNLPRNLSEYDFVFVNSISEGKITADEIRALKAKHPGTSFILVYHTTKAGEFRGSQEHAHLVDVMVQVHDGIAEANGRYGRGHTRIWFGKNERRVS